MNNERKLPEEAYLALRGLKEQAVAVSANQFKGDKKALGHAQTKMSEVEPWTKAIYRKLMGNKESLTIDDIDENWLESQFI